MNVRHAFTFYATNDTYALAVLVFVTRLRALGIGAGIGVHVLHLRVSRYLLDRLREANVVTERVAALPFTTRGYYRDCLVKLRLFTLTQYDRVVYLDADALPLRSLDDLFELPFDGPIAAPPAYWLPHPMWGSHLLVVKPSLEAWHRVSRHFGHAARRRQYDMDILNAEFGQEIHPLPAHTVCLDSEWEDARRPGAFGSPVESITKASVVHFTALAKPWSMTPRLVRTLRPDAHPEFFALRELWWQIRTDIIRETRGVARAGLVSRSLITRADAAMRHRLRRLSTHAMRLVGSRTRADLSAPSDRRTRGGIESSGQ